MKKRFLIWDNPKDGDHQPDFTADARGLYQCVQRQLCRGAGYV